MTAIEQIQYQLQYNNIIYDMKSASHYVVEGNAGYIDYWPTTGKWKSRTTSEEGFGVMTLIKLIRP